MNAQHVFLGNSANFCNLCGHETIEIEGKPNYVAIFRDAQQERQNNQQERQEEQQIKSKGLVSKFEHPKFIMPRKLKESGYFIAIPSGVGDRYILTEKIYGDPHIVRRPVQVEVKSFFGRKKQKKKAEVLAYMRIFNDKVRLNVYGRENLQQTNKVFR